MKAGKNILFMQNKTHKAGAQTALYSILKNPNMRGHRPFLLASSEGWLTEACRKQGVDCLVRRFPNSRSIPARLFRNRVFAGGIKRELSLLGTRPDIVHGNDYLEGLLALSVAEEFGAKCAITLRSSKMTGRDFYKYRCDRFDLIVAIGDELYAKARDWSRGKRVVMINDGLYASEFSKQRLKPQSFPGRVLVIGDQSAGKGWQDLLDAFQLLGQNIDLPDLQLDFIGGANSSSIEEGGLKRYAHRGISLNFMGEVELFKELVCSYSLVINPSRGESFGRAAMEVLAAGVPLISSRTGAVKEVITNERLLFNPADPLDMARVLEDVMLNWEQLDLNLSGCHRRMKEYYDIDSLVVSLVQEYEALTA